MIVWLEMGFKVLRNRDFFLFQDYVYCLYYVVVYCYYDNYSYNSIVIY